MWKLSSGDYGVRNSKRIRSFTELYFSPLRLLRGTARIPLLSSEIGRHVWPPKSSFSDMSYSCTSIRSRANSGTVRGNSNSSFQEGTQLSSKAFVFFITESTGTPAIPTWGHRLIKFQGEDLYFYVNLVFCGEVLPDAKVAWTEMISKYINLPLHKSLEANTHQNVCEENHNTILPPYTQLPFQNKNKKSIIID